MKTVSHTDALPPKPPRDGQATKPAGVLAFTGFGQIGQLMALLGMILVVIGLRLVLRRRPEGATWLLGW